MACLGEAFQENAMVAGWYIRLGQLRGVPILMHILTPVGALLFSQGQFEPTVWLGFTLLVLLHEVGHALVVKKVGGQVQQLELHPMGGSCVWYGNVSHVGRACIAFGGIWMQLLLYIAAECALAFLDTELSGATEKFVKVFTRTNLVLIALNLLPFPPFDGAEAWKLFPLLVEKHRKGARRKQLEAEALRLQTELDQLKAELDRLDGKKKEEGASRRGAAEVPQLRLTLSGRGPQRNLSGPALLRAHEGIRTGTRRLRPAGQ
jgi:hypothetical protein